MGQLLSMNAPKLPSIEEMRDVLDQLEANEGSTVLLGITWPRHSQNFPVVAWTWLSAPETLALRKSLTTARRRRKEAA